MAEPENLDDALSAVEPSRRRFIKRVAVGAAFATPIVSSFSMSGMSVNIAAGQTSNLSGGTGNLN